MEYCLGHHQISTVVVIDSMWVHLHFLSQLTSSIEYCALFHGMAPYHNCSPPFPGIYKRFYYKIQIVE